MKLSHLKTVLCKKKSVLEKKRIKSLTGESEGKGKIRRIVKMVEKRKREFFLRERIII